MQNFNIYHLGPMKIPQTLKFQSKIANYGKTTIFVYPSPGTLFLTVALHKK